MIVPGMLAAMVAVVSVAIVVAALMTGADRLVWHALFEQPQLPRALVLSLATGLGATLLSCLLALVIVSGVFPGPRWAALIAQLPPMLALPHAAVAIAMVLLVAPSGWLLRWVSPWLTGWHSPPLWTTSQDPYGLGLVLVLVLKEVPFLLWTAATQLQRPDTGQRLTQEWTLAQSMGYPARLAWWRVVAPQLVASMRWPALAVLAYSLTVVDMALVIGPTSPPTLAVLALGWLQDADPATNQQGAAAAWLLALILALCTGAGAALVRLGSRYPGGWIRQHLVKGVPKIDPAIQAVEISRRSPSSTARSDKAPVLSRLWVGIYALLAVVIVISSVAGVWPFPQIWPEQFTWQAWQSVYASSSTLGITTALALASSLTAVAWAMAWLEWRTPALSRALNPFIFLPLVLPPLLWTTGLHRVALAIGADTTGWGLYLAHTYAVLPYVVIAISPAYTGFDPRLAHLTASLGKSHWQFLLQVKWPMLRAAISTGCAIGFAVSVAQYLPTLFIGAGRFNTVTTEAINQAAGSQRSISAAYAALQCTLPLLAFAWANWAGKNRRFSRRS